MFYKLCSLSKLPSRRPLSSTLSASELPPKGLGLMMSSCFFTLMEEAGNLPAGQTDTDRVFFQVRSNMCFPLGPERKDNQKYDFLLNQQQEKRKNLTGKILDSFFFYSNAPHADVNQDGLALFQRLLRPSQASPHIAYGGLFFLQVCTPSESSSRCAFKIPTTLLRMAYLPPHVGFILATQKTIQKQGHTAVRALKTARFTSPAFPHHFPHRLWGFPHPSAPSVSTSWVGLRASWQRRVWPGLWSVAFLETSKKHGSDKQYLLSYHIFVSIFVSKAA